MNIANNGTLVFNRADASSFAGTISGKGGLTKLGAGVLTITGSPGTVTVGSGFTADLSQSGTSVFEITSPLYTASSFGLVSGGGSVVFGGVLGLNFSGGRAPRAPTCCNSSQPRDSSRSSPNPPPTPWPSPVWPAAASRYGGGGSVPDATQSV